MSGDVPVRGHLDVVPASTGPPPNKRSLTNRRAAVATIRALSAEPMRAALLGLVVIDLALVLGNALSYRAFFSQPGAGEKLGWVTVLLLAYGGGGLAITRSLPAERCRTLALATAVGMALGVVEMTNITVETFTTLRGSANLAVTAPLILGPFAGWGALGGWASRGRTIGFGVLTAVWAAMITISVGLIAGLGLALADRGRLERNLIADPDFIRSHWSDVKAFVLANAFDNGSTHLLGGVIVGATVGLIGAVAALRWRRS